MWPWERSIDSPNDEPGASILYLLPIFWAPADLQGFFRRPRATSCFRMSQHRLISAYLLAKRTKWPSHCAKHTVAIRLQVSLGAKSKMAAPCARSVLVRDRKKGEFCRHIYPDKKAESVQGKRQPRSILADSVQLSPHQVADAVAREGSTLPGPGEWPRV